MVVVPYSQLTQMQTISFGGVVEQSNVYAAVENGVVVRYFMFQNNKIISFDYMKKGEAGPHYFIGY